MSYERRDFQGAAALTTLAAGLSAGVTTTFTIDDDTGWPDGSSGDFFVVVDPSVDPTNPNSLEEKIRCSSRTGTTVSIASGGRGADGTSDVTHASGARVWHVFSALDADEANYTVAETVGKVTGAGELLVGDAVNSLTPLANGTTGHPLVAGASTPAYGQIDTGGIADDAVDSDQIAAGAIDLAHMSANSVDSDQYVDGSIDRVHLAADVIDGTKIEDDAVDSEHIADGSIDTAHIAAAQVTLAKLATAAKSQTKTWASPTDEDVEVVSTDKHRWYPPFAISIVSVRAAAGTAPTGADLIVDVHKSGATIFTTQANRPTIAASGNVSDEEVPDVTSVSTSEYLTVQFDQIGSTVAGKNVTVDVEYTLA